MKVTRQPFGFEFPRTFMRVARWSLLLSLLAVLLVACDSATPAEGTTPVEATTEEVAAEVVTEEAPQTADPGAAEVLPVLEPLTLAEGEKLRVVATTSLIGDIVRRVGGEEIEVTVLMPLGVDPHNYTPTPQDLRTLNEAHLILINGLGLEESLMPVLSELETPVPVVSVNAGIAPLTYGIGTEAEAASTEEEVDANSADQSYLLDPHTWLSVNNVLIWVDNIAGSIATLDAAHVDSFFSNASVLQEELTALEAEVSAQLDTVPAERRKLVTDHQEFNYFAQDYGFEVLGAVIPGVSTMTSPSAQELAALQEAITAAGVDAIFVGENVDDSVVSQLANDVGLEVVKLYTSSLSEADGPAPDYATLMRYNVNAIVSALAE